MKKVSRNYWISNKVRTRLHVRARTIWWSNSAVNRGVSAEEEKKSVTGDDKRVSGTKTRVCMEREREGRL